VFASFVASGNIVNPVVLLTGGFAEDKGQVSVEVFSPWNGSCSKDLEDLPNKERKSTLNFFKDKIIMCGGVFEKKKCLSLNENQQFVPHSQLNIGHDYPSAVVLGDKLLVVGSYGSNKSMEAWDGSKWVILDEDIEEIDDIVRGHCMAAVSEDTFLMASYYSNKMVQYKDGVWEQLEDYPGPARTRLSCAFIETPEGGAFLIAGGWDSDENYLDSSYLYNIEKKEWEEVGKLNLPRSSAKILVVDGRPIIIGGVRDTWYFLVDVEEYNMETKEWTTIEQKIKRGRLSFGAAVIPGAAVGC